jgi:hypothetical protein
MRPPISRIQKPPLRNIHRPRTDGRKTQHRAQVHQNEGRLPRHRRRIYFVKKFGSDFVGETRGRTEKGAIRKHFCQRVYHGPGLRALSSHQVGVK